MLPLFLLAAAAYAGVVFAHAAEGAEGEHPLRRFVRPGLLLAAVLHVAVVGAGCIGGTHPLASTFLALGFGGLCVVVGYLWLARGERLQGLAAAIASFGLLGLLASVLFGAHGPAERLPATKVLAQSHIALATLGLAGFALACGVALVYLGMERRLRLKRFKPGSTVMSLTAVDRLHHRLVLVATPVLTLAIATGILWTVRAGGVEALGDRVFELAGALLAWGAAVGLLVGRGLWGLRGRRSAWLTLVALAGVISVFLSYGVRAG